MKHNPTKESGGDKPRPYGIRNETQSYQSGPWNEYLNIVHEHAAPNSNSQTSSNPKKKMAYHGFLMQAKQLHLQTCN
jgi:hypothetical protein